MRLADYLKEKGIDPKDFAREIDVKQPSISRYLTGKRIPRPEKMAAIQKATGGEVTATDFYEAAAQ